TVSCFIYNDETPTRGFCQSLPQHLFQNCSCMSEGREIDPITNQPGQRTAQTVLWYRLSQAPAKPACDRIVREIVKPWQSNSLRVSRQKLDSRKNARFEALRGERSSPAARFGRIVSVSSWVRHTDGSMRRHLGCDVYAGPYEGQCSRPDLTQRPVLVYVFRVFCVC